MGPRRFDSAMDSPLSMATRPWTPPENNSPPHSDYFSDPFRPPSSHLDSENRWSNSSNDLHKMAAAPRCDTPTELLPRPKLAERLTDPTPRTPVRTLDFHARNPGGALRYPYTPDSSRMLRRVTDIPSSPPSWDDTDTDGDTEADTYSCTSASPVQDALSSCIAHFENLIHSQHPDEDQLEYIVAQFENMTSFLAAPTSQSRKSDDHLFADADPATRIRKDDWPKEAREAYIAEVSAYISGVKTYIADLKMRLDEVRTLNSIQIEVITELKRQMRNVSFSLASAGCSRPNSSAGPPSAQSVASSSAYSPASKDEEFGKDSWQTLVPDDDDPLPCLKEDADEHSSPLTSQHPSPMPSPAAASVEKSETKKREPRYRVIHIVRQPERRSFWASFGEALDGLRGLMLDYED